MLCPALITQGHFLNAFLAAPLAEGVGQRPKTPRMVFELLGRAPQVGRIPSSPMRTAKDVAVRQVGEFGVDLRLTSAASDVALALVSHGPSLLTVVIPVK